MPRGRHIPIGSDVELEALIKADSGGGGGSVPISSPLDIVDCILWLNAADIPGAVNNQGVATWPDHSGNGYDATNVEPDNEVQTVDIGGAGSGQYELLDPFTDDPTIPIAWDADAAAVQSALEGLPSIGAGNVTVSLDTQVYTVEFVGDLAGAPIPLLGEAQDTLDVEPLVNETQTGTLPLYKTNIQGGKPVVRFAGAQRLDFSGDALSMLSGLDGVTVFAVARNDQFQSGGYLYFSRGDTGGSPRLFGGYPGWDICPDDTGAGETSDIGVDAVVPPIFVVSTLTCDNNGVGAVRTDFSASKTLVSDFSTGAGWPLPFEETPSVVGSIGHEDYNPTFYTGDIPEIIIYGRALNLAERREIIDYLADKWAIY